MWHSDYWHVNYYHTDYWAEDATAIIELVVGVIQSAQQSVFRSIGSSSGTYNEDAIAAFKTDLSNDAGTYNELMIRWLQQKLSSTSTNIQDLKAAAAADRGVSNWQEIADPEDIGT